MKEEKQNTLTATIGYGLRTAIVGAWWGEKFFALSLSFHEFFALTLSFHEPFRHGAVVRLDAQEIQTGGQAGYVEVRDHIVDRQRLEQFSVHIVDFNP